MSFYFISRIMGFFINNNKPLDEFYFTSINGYMEIIMKIISTIMPRLDLFTKSSWITKTASIQEIKIIIIQFIIYGSLLLLMSFYDFNKKKF
tara:strand:- start:180 stop:455 length:276 start_codon:yes stop_codon:yes gene_type:complete